MKKIVFGTVVIVACVVLFYWQHRSIRQLRAENAALDAAASELDLLREEAEQLRKSRTDPAELERARQAQAELLRLRGEVSQLREQLKAERQASRATREKSVAVAPSQVAEEAESMVETYSATLRATLAPQQSLVTGGWRTQDGKRTFVLVEPAILNNAGEGGQVIIQAKFIQAADEALPGLGLDGITVEGRESSAQAVLNSEQTQELLSRLKETQGVTLMTAPKISTLDGRQAMLKVGGTRTVNGVVFEVGPSVDLVPRITADGGLDLSVIAQYRESKVPIK